MVRLAPLIHELSAGMSVGESLSDVFHNSAPLSISLSIFCEEGVFSQKAKNLSMVMGPALLLVMFIPSSVSGEFVMALRATFEQIGSAGPMGVFVGVGVLVKVGVAVGVKVAVPVWVGVKVAVKVGVFVCVGVLDGVEVAVKVGVLVRVGVLDGVEVFVTVGVLVRVGVRV